MSTIPPAISVSTTDPNVEAQLVFGNNVVKASIELIILFVATGLLYVVSSDFPTTGIKETCGYVAIALAGLLAHRVMEWVWIIVCPRIDHFVNAARVIEGVCVFIAVPAMIYDPSYYYAALAATVAFGVSVATWFKAPKTA